MEAKLRGKQWNSGGPAVNDGCLARVRVQLGTRGYEGKKKRRTTQTVPVGVCGNRHVVAQQGATMQRPGTATLMDASKYFPESSDPTYYMNLRHFPPDLEPIN